MGHSGSSVAMSTFTPAAFLFVVISVTVAEQGCNNGDTGIDCCMEGFTKGDNESDEEIFIQREQYNISCENTCKTLYPNSEGITEHLLQTYRVQIEDHMFWNTGWKKCWCEFGTKLQNAKTEPAYYQTCLFMEEAQWDACNSWVPLNDTLRHIDNSTTPKDPICDPLSNMWFRFTGNSGSKLPEGNSSMMGSQEGGKRNCGTSYLPYLITDGLEEEGCHSCISDGIVSRNVCFESVSTMGSSYEDCHGEKRSIKVAACKDHEKFFVYNFGDGADVDGCHTFCAVD